MLKIKLRRNKMTERKETKKVAMVQISIRIPKEVLDHYKGNYQNFTGEMRNVLDKGSRCNCVCNCN